MWDHMKNKKEKKKQAQVITFKYNQTLRHNHSKTQKNYNQKEESKFGKAGADIGDEVVGKPAQQTEQPILV